MPVAIELLGQPAPQARLPDLFAGVSRDVDPARSVFLPEGYLVPRGTWDVGARTRDSGAAATLRHRAGDDEVLVLELADGSILVSSAARLAASLRRTHPELIAPDGTLLLEQLRASGAQARGAFGEAVGGLVAKVFSVGVGARPDDIVADALRDSGLDLALLGVSWAGTKALMWAVEKRLPRGPGLYAWSGGELAPQPVAQFDARVLAEPQRYPMLVFLHGTGSHTLGSFGDLRSAGREFWAALEQRYPGGVYGYEHRTLSESPIENALALLELLPARARVDLVSHSRGGLVGDLLCTGDLAALIPAYRHDLPGTGDADPAEAARVIAELRDAHAAQRELLQRLSAQLQAKQPQLQRYVRVACPAAGTLLASGNFDLFLSGLLTLIGRVPGFFGSPYYAAFKRVVIEIARNRTNPRLVPGIEAMLPDAPLARLLRDAPVRDGLRMGLIAGDIEGGNLLQRLGVLLTDHLLFSAVDNDLVVDTPAMLAGVAPRAGARVKFDRGADVSHFRYFENADTRDALNDWLMADDPAAVAAFSALPDPAALEAALQAASREVDTGERPVVLLLPGVMGTHLARGDDRIWFDPVDLAAGGLAQIAWGSDEVVPQDLFALAYGRLCAHLAASHRVERFGYDWRQPLDVLADRLAERLQALMARSPQPIRLLAHSMGGLVVRACIHRHRALMDTLMARPGARFVMLGTPNQGAYSMVANLLGKGDALRALARLDLKHDLQQLLDIVAGFRGALALLPKPGFQDQFQGQSDGGSDWDFQRAETWSQLGGKVRDLWFGDGRCGRPVQEALDAAGWLWAQDGPQRPALPPGYEGSTIYVFGQAANTPCGLREIDGRLKMIGTSRGDGSVSWESGRIGGVGSSYYMPAVHGDLADTAEHFPALVELLQNGRTDALPQQPGVTRELEQPVPVAYDAGPPQVEDAESVQRRITGAATQRRAGTPSKPQRKLVVTVRAQDLRFVTQPILVGHYDQDPIAGPQALIDRELLGNELGERYRLGLYPGPLGSATAVLRVPNRLEAERGSLVGAVVTGLGSYDRALTLDSLTQAVRTGALRYLLHAADVLGREERELPLAALLLGYNSSANLTVGASVEALVRGVHQANVRFHESTRLAIRIARLDIVELYTDTAITAVYALRQLEPRLAEETRQRGTQLVCRGELVEGEGARQRLFDAGGGSYWPRLMVIDADRPEETAAPDPTGEQGFALARRALVPNRLRFLFVGQRARAESVVQQRQPGLVEKLVRGQILNPVWQEDFGRMLFQLLVPHDFKDAARQLDRVVLVVDSYTANLPWELMLADDSTGAQADRRPLALRAAVVRQLASADYRRQVRQSLARTALVVGNPSVEGFEQAFPGTPERPSKPPPPLQGAEAEAQAIAALVGGAGYEVRSVIGAEQTAKDVLALLYRQPWRLLHISAHGVFDLLHADGRKRSGVLLSDGLLITAAEIDAMEAVPELVFLNCCHLGKIDSALLRDGNKLAASVARELIEIGVRCVVVAGWAVDDRSAQVFGQHFYAQLLQQGRPFGEAVFTARQRAWEANPDEITWGAFQAYGDPGWVAEPRVGTATGAAAGQRFVSPEELLDALAGLRAEVARRGSGDPRALRGQRTQLEALLRERCPPGWLARGDLQSALGATWRDLGDFAKSRAAFLAALQSDDQRGRVPIRDLEQLANVEARLGDQSNRADLIQLALYRLETLDRLTAPDFGGETGAAPRRSPERSALFGSAYKRLAGLHARLLLGASPSPDEAAQISAALRQALEHSRDAYRGTAADAAADPYLLLNRLALEALTPWAGREGDRAAAVALAHEAGRRAAERFAAAPDFWNAVMQAEAGLVEHLLDGSLGAEGTEGDGALEEVAAGYVQALAGVIARPGQVDSVTTQMDLLSRFCDALSLDAGTGAGALRRTADRLQALAQRLQPGHARRLDRPKPLPAPLPAARKATRKSPARRASTRR